MAPVLADGAGTEHGFGPQAEEYLGQDVVIQFQGDSSGRRHRVKQVLLDRDLPGYP